jgi:DNA-binding NarL/FixJ family response regulator
MKCRNCSSTNTRVTCTNHFDTLTKRYCRCLDCGEKFRTVERYEVAKPIPLEPSVKAGSDNPNSRLTPHQVKLIRYLSQKGYTNGQIALRLKMHRSTICKIVNYKTYTNIA